MISHADVAIMQACVGLGHALKYILEAILLGLGGVLLSGALLVIANRQEFCPLCMQMYNEFCWLPLEALPLRACIALITIHVLAETEQWMVLFFKC